MANVTPTSATASPSLVNENFSSVTSPSVTLSLNVSVADVVTTPSSSLAPVRVPVSTIPSTKTLSSVSDEIPAASVRRTTNVAFPVPGMTTSCENAPAGSESPPADGIVASTVSLPPTYLAMISTVSPASGNVPVTVSAPV